MRDPHRLADLERQRALIAAHLRWLDEQIERERLARSDVPPSGVSGGIPEPRVRPVAEHLPAAVMPPPGVEAQVVPLHEPDPLPSKAGCWMAFAGLMLGLGGAVALFIYFRYGRG